VFVLQLYITEFVQAKGCEDVDGAPNDSLIGSNHVGDLHANPFESTLNSPHIYLFTLRVNLKQILQFFLKLKLPLLPHILD
jgi:hypothetical protein